MAMAPPYGLALNVTSTRRCPLREFDLGRLDGKSRSSPERAAGIGRAMVIRVTGEARAMQAAGGGSIVNTGSGEQPRGGAAPRRS